MIAAWNKTVSSAQATGRTPRVNNTNSGRPLVASHVCDVAGGGMKMGQVIGSSSCTRRRGALATDE
ncbi:MAG: hypothetical protein U0744_14040 [Gemmataceae bacterium]